METTDAFNLGCPHLIQVCEDGDFEELFRNLRCVAL